MQNDYHPEQISSRSECSNAKVGGLLEDASDVAQRVLESVQALAGTTYCKRVQIAKLKQWAQLNGRFFVADAHIESGEGTVRQRRTKGHVTKHKYKKHPRMKRIILLLGCCLSSLTNTQAQTLVIWNTNSIVSRIDLAQKPVVKVLTDKLQVTGDGIKLEYKAEDVSRFTFEEKVVGIESTD